MNYDPFRELDRVTGGMFENRGAPRLMPMDLYRDGDHYLITADMPGIDPGSVDIDVDGQLLTIRAERTLSNATGVKWIARERQAGSFLRQLNLGQGIDTEHIAATYDNGVLSVTIPMMEKAKPRKIEIRSAAKGNGHREVKAPAASGDAGAKGDGSPKPGK